MRTLVRIAGREVWRERGGADGVSVAVLEGAVWVTREGDPTDYVLRAGDRWCSGGAGLVVIEPLDGGAALFETAPNGPGARKVVPAA